MSDSGKGSGFGAAFVRQRRGAADADPVRLRDLLRRLLRPPSDPKERQRLVEQIRFLIENLRAHF